MAVLRRTQWRTGPGTIFDAAHGVSGPGFWAVEAGCVPPAAHTPSRLLGRFPARARMAVTLRTATMLPLNLGMAASDRLGLEGCQLAAIATLALHEILVNAAIHGNLEVCIGQLGTWHDLAQREDLIEAALQDPAKSGRLVTLAVGWNDTSVVACVIDEGVGYTAAPRRRTDGRASRAASGRGLMVAHAAGRVDVLRGGSCTRLVFPRLPPDGAGGRRP